MEGTDAVDDRSLTVAARYGARLKSFSRHLITARFRAATVRERFCRKLALALLVAALGPSGYLAWRARDMPHLGYFHDDALYWVSAKSLAEGHGYRIASLPGQPCQTKYPPLYPALLAMVWKLDPAFPGNLRLAMLLCWLMLPAVVALAWIALADLGFPPRQRAVLCAILALDPYNAVGGISLLSELPFTCALLGALALIERARSRPRGAWLAALAGLAASAAFLTRSAGILLLALAPLLFLLRRQYRHAVFFTAAMLPAVLGWNLWVHVHRAPASDPAALYYTDYLGFFLDDLHPRDLALFFWKNLDSMLSGIGGLFVFNLGDSFAGKSLGRVLAVGAIAGSARLARRAGLNSYHLFTGAYLLSLLFWHYVPDERFLLPVFPVLLAGLSAEVLNLVRVARASRQRVAAGVVWAALAALVALAAVRAGAALVSVLPRFVAYHRGLLESHRPVYRWMEANLPRDAALLAYQDPLVYLYTGRPACRLVIPAKPLYRGDRRALEKMFEAPAAYACRKRLSYAVLTPIDFNAELTEPERRAAARLLRRDPRLRPLYESAAASIYRVDQVQSTGLCRE